MQVSSGCTAQCNSLPVSLVNTVILMGLSKHVWFHSSWFSHRCPHYISFSLFLSVIFASLDVLNAVSSPLWHQIFLFPVSSCWAAHFETVYRYCCFPLLPKTAHETYIVPLTTKSAALASHFNWMMFWEKLQVWLRVGCFFCLSSCVHGFNTLLVFHMLHYEPLDYWLESGQDSPLWHKDNDIHHATANEIEIHYCK